MFCAYMHCIFSSVLVGESEFVVDLADGDSSMSSKTPHEDLCRIFRLVVPMQVLDMC